MKKLLTLILPALALTTGAPLAAAADYYGHIQWGHKKNQLALYRKNNSEVLFYVLSIGKTSAEAARQEVQAKCDQAADKRQSPCYGDYGFSFSTISPAEHMAAWPDAEKWPGVVAEFIKEHPNGMKCIAYFNDTDYELLRGNVKRGGSKEEAMNKSKQACESDGIPGCRLVVTACADDGVPQVADAGGAAQQAASPAPAQAADGASGERYGAFAIDEGAWAYGFSLLAPSPDEANRAALARCVQEGGDECEISYVFNGSRCGAAAVAEEQGLRAWGYGHAESRYEAVDTALGFCERDNTSGGECRLVSVACGE